MVTDGVLRVGACQTPEILGDVEAALACVERFAAEAYESNVDLLLFPECFLQGYLVEEEHLRTYAIELASAEFAAILDRLKIIDQSLVLGVIERRHGKYYNSAVVITHGEIVGVYRKTHLTAGERLFEPGDSYPTFELKGVRFGINICYDTRFPDAAAPVAEQGARLLLVPAQNMIRRPAAEEWKHRHNQIRAERVQETGMWLVSADVTGERDGLRVGYGPTSVMNPRTEVVAQVPLGETGMVVATVPGSSDVYRLVERITPFDELEARHRAECLAWLRRTDDVYRRVKPSTPPMHLVSYFLVHDDRDSSVLLVDHIKAGLWLPSGGHVEPGEHPADTVRREVREELGVPAAFSGRYGDAPVFLTITETVGAIEERHTDVSLWFVLAGSRDEVYTPDLGEFRSVRWWSRAEVSDADPGRFEPHLGRVLAKLG